MVAVGGAFSLLWWFVRQRLVSAQEQIKDLYKKHDDGARSLNRLALRQAERYNPKHEIHEPLAEMRQHFGRLLDQLAKIAGSIP